MRSSGLRSTPQRRAILAAFTGGDAEHLSADEVYARAATSLPDLGRGTVYATLAEFSEVGLLAAFGSPEPVRYETNTQRHAHFRCRVCLRIFDVSADAPGDELGPFQRRGHRVEELDLRAEGVCRDCVTYEHALESAVETIVAHGASDRLRDIPIAVGEVLTPVGPLLVAASQHGVARVAFPEHADAAFLRGRLGGEDPPGAAEHLRAASDQLTRYFAGETRSFDCAIDWELVGHVDDLRAAMDVPYGSVRSYHLLNPDDDVTAVAVAYGANPIPIISPCHRVSRGVLLPDMFVGGAERRTWLIAHERHALEG